MSSSSEDSPQFNTGNGADFTYEGTNERDASIMDGRMMMAGAGRLRLNR